jgi:hypothetical protein
MKNIKKRAVIICLVTAAALGVSSLAYAFFSSTGQGTGSATTGSSTPFVVASTADTLGDLVPNSTIGSGVKDTISYSVNNPSTGSEKLSSVVISIGNTTGTSPSTTETNWTAASGSNPACNSSDFSVGAQAVGDGTTAASGAYTVSPSVDLAAGATYNGTFTLQMVDNSANQNSCEGVTVPLYISAS